jgi:ABC-2 type transport system ATP-binding protein
LDEVNHVDKPTEHAKDDWSNRLGSVVVSNAVEVNDLVVAFGALRAVDGVSLHVAYGEVVTLLGPNGAGKTTAVETLLGFREPTSGTARLHGLNPVRDHREVVVRTGALLQRGGVWFPMTPRQVLDLTASYYDAPRDTDELLDLLDLARCARTPWRRLSGGEQQRTLLALALLGRPRVLVLDEPTTGVDPEGRQVIRDLIASERDRGCALLVTTHELTEAERMADRVVIMNRGHVVIDGTLEELSGAPEMIVELSGPVDPAALAALLGCVVTADAGHRLRCETASTPERLAQLNDFLTGVGVTLTSLRTRASLEERYLELIEQERREVRP